MSHLSKIPAALFFILVSACTLLAQNQVEIILKQPPPNQMGVGDMWNLELNNTTGKDMKIYLTGTATEEKDGLIIEGKSKPFTIKPGRSNYKYNNFSGAEVKYNNGKYKEIILRTGNAPEGNYSVCVTAFNESGEVVGMENCITQTVMQMGSISLLTPGDGEEIDPKMPIIFTWTPLPKGGPYSLRIVELKGDQSPDVAIKQNRAIFEKDGIAQSSVQVDKEFDKMAVGKKYAWVVNSGDVQSEAMSFVLKPKESTGGITLVSPKNATEIDALQPVTFSWNPISTKEGERVTYRLKVWQLMEGQSGTTAMRTNQPIITKDVDNITQVTVSNIYTGPCKPPYLCDYIWAVESISIDGMNSTQSGPFTFTGHASRLTLELPLNGDKLDAQKEITFKWKDAEADPNKPVTYRLRVWQLMQGQTGSQAMKENQPVATKDVDNITQVTVSNIYTGPCKPPYLCDYIWNVQVLDQGQPVENSNSEASTFKVISKDTSDEGPPLIAIGIKITFGRKKEACKNKGICDVEITFSWETFKPEDNTGRGEITAIDGKTIEIKINKTTGLTSAGYEKYFSNGFFDLEEDYIFGNDIKEMLKMKEVVNVKAGRYEVKENDGFLTMRFTSEGSSPTSAMVAMKMGRPQTIGNCKETGCCHNEIYEYKDGSNLMEREIKMKLTFEGDMLRGEFMSELPEKGNEFPISENIVLDKNTCAKLGFESITISPDNYKIEYSGNTLGVLYLKVKEKGNRTK